MPPKDPEARKAYLKAYQEKNRERLQAQARERQAKKAEDPEWLEKERERCRQKAVRQYYAKKAEGGPSEEERAERAAYQKQYREEHRERHNELNRESKARHRDEIRAKAATPEEQEKARERHADWLARNPGYVEDYERNRRIRPDGWLQDRREHYQQNRETIRAQQKERYDSDPAFRMSAIARAHARYLCHKEEIREKAKQYRDSHKEASRERDRAYRGTEHGRSVRNAANRNSYRRNRDKNAAYKLRYMATNRVRIQKANAAYYELHKDEINARNSQWWRSHREFAIKYQNERRARLENAPGHHTERDVLDLWERQEHRCAVPGCTYPITAESGPDKYHVDHMQPLTKGGSNGPENLQILCRTHNLRKHNKEAKDWFAENGMEFPACFTLPPEVVEEQGGASAGRSILNAGLDRDRYQREAHSIAR